MQILHRTILVSAQATPLTRIEINNKGSNITFPRFEIKIKLTNLISTDLGQTQLEIQ